MRNRLKSMGLTFLMVVLSGVCVTVVNAAAFDLFGTTSSTSFGNPNTLVRVDSSTGVQTLAGIVGLATNTTDIDWNPLTQTLFGSNLFDNEGVIQEIDPATGIATPIATILQDGNPVRLWALAFTSNGTLWGVAGNNAITGLTLGLIDLNTQTFSPQLALPSRLAVAGIDITPNGVLYGIFQSLLPEPFRQTLFTIDLGTLSIIDQQVLASTFNIDDIDFAPDGFIYHTNFSPSLFRLDPNTGTTTRVGQGSLGALGGLASPLQNLNDKFAPLGSGDVATAFSFTPCGGASAGTFTITATFTNISADTLSNLLISVQTLTGGNVLCNANGGPGGAGATLTVPLEGDLADGQLSTGESFVVELPVGLQSFNSFTFLVDVLGIAIGDNIQATVAGFIRDCVQVTCSRDGIPDNTFTNVIEVLSTSNNPATGLGGGEDQGIIEVDLSTLTMPVSSAVLALNVFGANLLPFDIAVYTYNGDGLLTFGDWNQGLLVTTFSYAGEASVFIDLTQSVNQAILAGIPILGVNLRFVGSSPIWLNGPFVAFTTSNTPNSPIPPVLLVNPPPTPFLPADSF